MRLDSFFRKIHHIIIIFALLLILCVYYYFMVTIAKHKLHPSPTNYYIYLLDALFHGHIYLDSHKHYDLSFFSGKYYMYWGPAPALLILPFYLLQHFNANDVLFTFNGGFINVLLFYLLMQEFKDYFSIYLSIISELFIIISFGLASPNFFLSLTGTVWYTGQIFSITYLLLFYLFYFKFLKYGKYYQFVLFTLFFCLAFLSRYTLLFHGILFIYLFLHFKNTGRTLPAKSIWTFALFALASICFAGFYNFLRFQNVLEMGLRFQVGAARYTPIVSSNAILSTRYIFYNFYYYFLNIVHFSRSHYHVIVDKEGNSIFSVYPALLLIPVLIYNRKYRDKKKVLFLITAGTTAVLNVSLLMLYFSTGWTQFGCRYFFDIIPLLFLLVMFILQYIPISIQVGLLLYGVYVNYYGIAALYHIKLP
jgi:hypothetical protein